MLPKTPKNKWRNMRNLNKQEDITLPKEHDYTLILECEGGETDEMPEHEF